MVCYSGASLWPVLENSVPKLGHEFLAAALAACSSGQYHVVLVLVVLVPKLLSEFEFFGFLRVPYVNMGLLRVNSGYIGKLRVSSGYTEGKLRVTKSKLRVN